jgi:hypothetical protein
MLEWQPELPIWVMGDFDGRQPFGRQQAVQMLRSIRRHDWLHDLLLVCPAQQPIVA